MTRTDRLRLWAAWGGCALVVGLGVLAAVLSSDHTSGRGVIAAVDLLVGWSFAVAGLVAWSRRPANNTGRLLFWTGIAFLLGQFEAANDRVVYTFGTALSALLLAAFVHLVVAYPEGTLRTAAERTVVAAGYALALLANVGTLMFAPHLECDACPTNLFLVSDHERVARDITNAADVIATLLFLAVLVVVVRRWRGLSPVSRKALVPVAWTGGPTVILLLLAFAISLASHRVGRVVQYSALLTFAALPWAFLAGLLRVRLARGAVARRLVAVPETASLEGTQEALREALDDPTLRIGAWLPDRGAYVDPAGEPFSVVADERRVATRVSSDDGTQLAIVEHDAALLAEPELLESAIAAARLSLHRNRLQAELRARLDELERERDFIARAVNAAPAYFCVLDLAGRVIRYNDTLAEDSGRVDDENVRGRAFWEIFPVQEHAELVEHAILSAAPGEHQHVWRSTDGGRIVVAWSLTPITDGGGEERLLLTGLDVSERARHEEELRRERDFLSRVGRATPTLLAVVHADGVVDERGVNDAFAEATGFDDSAAVGRVLWDLVDANGSGEVVRDAFQAAVATGELIRLETPWRSADGGELIVEWWTTSLEAYREDYYLVCGSDVTKRKRDEDEIRRSRARIVAAADAERRRLERNLHDGAQQRLVALSLALRLAESKVRTDAGAAAAILGTAGEELALALQELRELARGLHPAILTDRGLGPALEAVAERSPVPVDLRLELNARLPESVEAAIFYVVSESLANVAKYAGASSVGVGVECDERLASVFVADDGVGGADLERGSGLRGLADRVEALDGSFAVASPEGDGTIVRAAIPLAAVREPVPQDAG